MLNYTSTNDNLFKETIEKRKIRDAIKKLNSNGTIVRAVSIVEKKKQQRIITAIEQNVATGIESTGKKGRNMDSQNESSCRLTLRSNSPSPTAKISIVTSASKQNSSAKKLL